MHTLFTTLLFCLYLSIPAALSALFVQGRARRVALGGAATLAVVGALGAALVGLLLQ